MLTAKKSPKTISKSMFATNETPQKHTINAPNTPNLMEQFLAQDFQQGGYDDGYNYPTIDTLKLQKSSIKANFQQVIERMMQQVRKELLRIRTYFVGIQGISDTQDAQLQLKIEDIAEQIDLLKEQKQLCEQDKGLVMQAICSYEQGFKRGLSDYQTEKFFAQSTGFFFND